MRKQAFVLLGVLVALVAALVLGLSLASAQDGTVNVDLNEWNVVPGASSIAAGDVQFTASNTGAVEHELVIVRTDLSPDALPLVDGRVDEHGGLDIIGEIETDELTPGATASATFNLAPGNYVLLCNVGETTDEFGEVIEPHYGQGMFTGFTVTGAGAVSAAPAAGTGGPPSEGVFTTSSVALLAVLGTILLALAGSWAIFKKEPLDR